MGETDPHLDTLVSFQHKRTKKIIKFPEKQTERDRLQKNKNHTGIKLLPTMTQAYNEALSSKSYMKVTVNLEFYI